MIEQDTHLCGSEGAACGVIEHSTNLVKRDAGKPFDELRHEGAVFEILEERRHRHTSAPEDPSSADAFRVPFNGGASRPIDHGKMVSLPQRDG